MESILRDFDEAVEAVGKMNYALHLYEAEPTEEAVEMAGWWSNYLEYMMKWFAREIRSTYEAKKRKKP